MPPKKPPAFLELAWTLFLETSLSLKSHPEIDL
jgi:hypothetical protein